MESSVTEQSPLQRYLETLHSEISDYKEGEVASYIPELLRADPEWFGIAIATVDGHVYQVGDSQQLFTIQSISKAFVYGLALEDNGLHNVADRVDVEPSGEAFNSISLRPDTGRPLNPMINAGAIATTSMVEGVDCDVKIKRIIECFTRYVGHDLDIDTEVYQSEKETGHRNRAIAHLLRSFNILEDPPDGILDAYFQQCSINVNCRDLAVMGACLANNGVNPITGVRTLKTEYVPKVLSVMGTCGMYDYSGNWVYTVGMPAKSGVGGGIVAVLPGQLGLAVFSPRLDERGNSARGIKVCERISADYGLHLYHSVRATTSTVIRNIYDGTQVHSRKLRRDIEIQNLEDMGRKIKVFQLQGDLMFGTTESVLKHVLDVIKDADYFILDLKHVFEIDRSACQLLEKLSEAVIKSEKRMYFTYTTNKYGFRRYMKNHLGEIVEKLFQYDDTDHALERCEDVIIESLHLLKTESLSVDLSDQDLCIGLDDAEIEKLRAIVKPVTYEAGEKIFKCGDDARSLYMIQQGEAEVLLPTSSGQTIRLAMLSPGMYFGEMALLNHRTRSADVRTTRKSSLYEIVFEDIPDEIRYSLIANFAQLLAKKLGRETQELKHLD